VTDFIEDELPQLLTLLYEAALAPERWPLFFDLMSKHFADARGVLQFYDRKRNTTFANINFGTDPQFLKSFVEHYVKCNPYPSPTYSVLPVGEVVAASHVVDEPTLVATEFYNDWMRPQAIDAHHLGVVLQKDSHSMALLGIAPNASALRKDHENYLRKLQVLSPHLSRAIEMNRLTARAGFAERALADALDALPAAAFLIEDSGAILMANGLAEALLREERVICIDGRGGLEACRTRDDRALKAAIAAGMAPVLQQPSLPVPLVSTATGRAFLAWVMPTRRANLSDLEKGPVSLESFYRVRTVLVVVTSAEKGRTVPVEAIMSAFRLTAAEARLAGALCAGKTIAEYANETGLSRNTVRNQLAAVFAKTGTTRQTELVGLIVGALGPASHVGGLR
jgi:DNA-binding CsgD family transcriptional regulator/PAS domain-containing protein